jgi:hypothetical protein
MHPYRLKPGLQTTHRLPGASIADNLISQGMTQQRTRSDTASESASRTHKRRILFAALAALALIGGFILCVPVTNSRESLFDRMRRGFDEHRRAFDQRRRAWEDQRRADEQARRAAATTGPQNSPQPTSALQPTNP